MITVHVAIGSRKEDFVLIETNAPKNYDHGAAIELYDGTYDGEIDRYVLVPARDLAWQRNRNATGLHSAVTEELTLDEDDVARFLWKRLYGEEAA